MEEIIKQFIINELKMEKNFINDEKYIIITDMLITKFTTIFGLGLFDIYEILEEIKKEYPNYKLIKVNTVDDLRYELMNLSSYNYEYGVLLELFKSCIGLKLDEVRKQNFFNAAELRDIEMAIQGMLTNKKSLE